MNEEAGATVNVGATADNAARELYAKHRGLLELSPDGARQVLALAFMHGADFGQSATMDAMREALDQVRP